jgi:hypothetical protein
MLRFASPYTFLKRKKEKKKKAFLQAGVAKNQKETE